MGMELQQVRWSWEKELGGVLILRRAFHLASKAVSHAALERCSVSLCLGSCKYHGRQVQFSQASFAVLQH
jgi:hypothetical protein